MQHFPRWVHHKDEKDKLVHSAEELKQLGEGWGDDSSVWRSKPMQECEAEKEEPIAQLPQGQKAEEPKQKGKKGRK